MQSDSAASRLIGIADEFGSIWDGEPGASTRIGDLVQRADEETFEVRLHEFDPTDARSAMREEKLLLDLLSYVPGWIVMKRSEVDRLLNEQEALRIERDAARADLEARDA